MHRYFLDKLILKAQFSMVNWSQETKTVFQGKSKLVKVGVASSLSKITQDFIMPRWVDNNYCTFFCFHDVLIIWEFEKNWEKSKTATTRYYKITYCTWLWQILIMQSLRPWGSSVFTYKSFVTFGDIYRRLHFLIISCLSEYAKNNNRSLKIMILRIWYESFLRIPD